MIDRVTVKGSVEPLGKNIYIKIILDLYTCDIDTSSLGLAFFEPKLTKKEMKLKRAKARMARDRFRLLCFADQL
jgi:hypothetical protein